MIFISDSDEGVEEQFDFNNISHSQEFMLEKITEEVCGKSKCDDKHSQFNENKSFHLNELPCYEDYEDKLSDFEDVCFVCEYGGGLIQCDNCLNWYCLNCNQLNAFPFDYIWICKLCLDQSKRALQISSIYLLNENLNLDNISKHSIQILYKSVFNSNPCKATETNNSGKILSEDVLFFSDNESDMDFEFPANIDHD